MRAPKKTIRLFWASITHLKVSDETPKRDSSTALGFHHSPLDKIIPPEGVMTAKTICMNASGWPEIYRSPIVLHGFLYVFCWFPVDFPMILIDFYRFFKVSNRFPKDSLLILIDFQCLAIDFHRFSIDFLQISKWFPWASCCAVLICHAFSTDLNWNCIGWLLIPINFHKLSHWFPIPLVVPSCIPSPPPHSYFPDVSPPAPLRIASSSASFSAQSTWSTTDRPEVGRGLR